MSNTPLTFFSHFYIIFMIIFFWWNIYDNFCNKQFWIFRMFIATCHMYQSLRRDSLVYELLIFIAIIIFNRLWFLILYLCPLIKRKSRLIHNFFYFSHRCFWNFEMLFSHSCLRQLLTAFTPLWKWLILTQ